MHREDVSVFLVFNMSEKLALYLLNRKLANFCDKTSLVAVFVFFAPATYGSKIYCPIFSAALHHCGLEKATTSPRSHHIYYLHQHILDQCILTFSSTEPAIMVSFSSSSKMYLRLYRGLQAALYARTVFRAHSPVNLRRLLCFCHKGQVETRNQYIRTKLPSIYSNTQ